MNTVLEWLEADARRWPDKVAFADVAGSVTYAQLRQRARGIGAALARRVPARRAVALFLEKDVSAVCALLGVVHAGCCYSFVDLRQTPARVQKMMETLAPALVVTSDELLDQARETFPNGTALATVEQLQAEAAADDPSACDDPSAGDDLLGLRRDGALSTDPVYVNFTSGSTGTPKGVAVGHSSLIDFIPEFARTLGLSHDDVFACQAPFDFDVSVKDVFGALHLGATVHLIPRGYFSEPVRLMDFLVERRPTVLVWAVSAMCFVSIMGGFDYKVPETVRLVAFSGEVMPPQQLAAWRRALPGARFFNVYGPTEITCNCTYYQVERDFGADEVIPMGKPFANERVFLVTRDGGEGEGVAEGAGAGGVEGVGREGGASGGDPAALAAGVASDAAQATAFREVTQPGEEGEIYVGGATLAIGYYRDPQRTAQAFVQNPLHDDYFDRVYKTGDVARYDEQGNLVYVSRVDHQVKHMGQRIELGEIEAAAQAVPGVTRACCVYDAQRKRIKLFYTGDVDKKAVKAALADALPPFMRPNNTKQIAQMPLNKNGKIDRGMLERGEVRS